MHIPSPALRALEKLIGKQNVCTDEISLHLNAYDCSLSRMRPDLILHIPTSDLVAPTVQLLHQFRIPFVARAAGTNHAGSCSTPKGGAVLNLTALNHILQINTREGFVITEPGVITGQLQQALQPLGFFYAPDPASQAVCTLGGNIAQNASGARCLKYGGTLGHVLEITVVLPDGKIQIFSREQNGPDWVGVLIGSEGTLGIVTRLKIKILPTPKHIKTFLVTFPSLQDSVQTVTDLMAQGIIPRCVEAMDHTTLQAVEDFSHAGYPADAQALLLLELDGTAHSIKQDEKTVETVCHQNHALVFRAADTRQERARLWKGRQAAYSAMARLAPNVLVCDGTVPRSELPSTLKKVQELLTANHVTASLLFHAGDGNFHPQLVFDERNRPDTQRITRMAKQILQLCVEAGGTISGEHGVGVEKRSLMAVAYDEKTLDLFTQLKRAFDPDNLTNPSKIIPVGYAEKARLLPALSPQEQKIMTQFCAKLNSQKPFLIAGNNTSLKTKNDVFSTRELSQIIDVDLTNYTVTAQAGVTLTQLATALRAKHVYSVLPARGKHTLGGVFSSGQFPGFYAHVTGLKAILPNGNRIQYGGKLTKNAAGYNLVRLFAGAQGTLGLVTELVFKIYATKPAVLTPTPFKPFTPNVPFERLKKVLDPHQLLPLPPEETR
ncbi:FAD-binding oxidoreductase [Candidatus Avelusimicrobium caledoniensis]|uniref:FAD-binding oxidoreductase n=1 Tax=Candidatus Avelusimicrobium caledoniensis TaxID=3416220 RepID=UPI003D137BE0